MRSRVRVGDGYSEEFGVGVGVHQGSVLSPLLFIIVLEALSREFRTGCPWELLYADDLMISAESMDRALTRILKIGVKMAPFRKSWSFTILLYWDFSKSWSQIQKVGVNYSYFRVNETSDGGTAGKGEDLEDRDGEKGPTCEHGENKDNGVWY